MESLVFALVVYIISTIYKKSKTNTNVHKLRNDRKIGSEKSHINKDINTIIKNRDYKDLSVSSILDMVVENLSPNDKEKIKKAQNNKVEINMDSNKTLENKGYIEESEEELLNEYSKSYDSDSVRNERLKEIQEQRQNAKNHVSYQDSFYDDVDVSAESLQREFSHSELVNAIIMKEILDKPVSLREEGF